MKRKYNPDKASKAIEAAAQMPAGLRHSVDPGNFDISKSEVVDWLIQQPEIRKAIFGHYKDKGAIIFDKESGTWSGIASSSPPDCPKDEPRMPTERAAAENS